MSILDPKFVRRLEKVDIHIVSECECPPGVATMLAAAIDKNGPFTLIGYSAEPQEEIYDPGSLAVSFTRERNAERNFFLPGLQDEVSVTFYGIMRDSKEILVAKVSPLKRANTPFEKHDSQAWDALPVHEGWDAIFAAIDAALPPLNFADKE